MTEVTDGEIVALVEQHSPALATVVQRLLGEKDAARQDVLDRVAGLADAWAAVSREPPGDFGRAFRAAAGLLREVIGQYPPAKVLPVPAAAAGDGYTIVGVSEETFGLITEQHAERPGEPLTLTPAQVKELAGCGYEEGCAVRGTDAE